MFKTVSGFENYEISKSGTMREISSGNNVSWHKSNGYVMARIYDNHGNPVSIGQHRALALAYIKMPETNEKITVNHIDGVKSNNDLSNLEWVTYSENQFHAYKHGLRNDRVPVILTNLETGEVLNFFSKAELSRYLKIPCRVFSTPPFNGVRTITVNGYMFEFLIEESEFSRVQKYPTGVVARNVFTGLCTICSTEGELSRFIGICPKVISRILQKRRFEFPTNGYDIRIFDDEIKWPEYTNEELEAFSGLFFIHQPVLVTSDNGARKLLGSVKRAAEYAGVHERVVRECLLGRQKNANGFAFVKYNRELKL